MDVTQRIVSQSMRSGLVDLSVLLRETLALVRSSGSAARRSLSLVRLLPRLPDEARSELALALLTRISSGELVSCSRAGLLSLEAATRGVHEVQRQLAVDVVRAELARVGPVTRRLVGETLVCAEGVVARVDVQSARVVFVDDGGLEASEWAELLEAEARLTNQEHLAQFAALALAGRATVVDGKRVAASRWAKLVAMLSRVWFGDEVELPPVVAVSRAFIRSQAQSRA